MTDAEEEVMVEPRTEEEEEAPFGGAGAAFWRGTVGFNAVGAVDGGAFSEEAPRILRFMEIGLRGYAGWDGVLCPAHSVGGHGVTAEIAT